MNNKYPSFTSRSIQEPDYDCQGLKAKDYVLRARCNKTNPDCQKLIKDKKQENYSVKIIELEYTKYGNNMVDIWIKKHSSFNKINRP